MQFQSPFSRRVRSASHRLCVRLCRAWDYSSSRPRWEDVTSRMTNFALSPTGKRTVVEARGAVFTIPAKKGDVRNLTNSSGSAERDPAWSPDSKKVLYHDTILKAWVLDAESGKAKMVGNDPRMVPQRIPAPVWSPDSKWVAYASRLKSRYRAIWVTNVDTGDTRQVTDGLADAMYPVFDASGERRDGAAV